MDDTYDRDKSAYEEKDNATQYLDCIRLVEGGHIRRFEQYVAKFDVVQYELSDDEDRPTKSLLFYAIEHNDEPFIRVLLEMEVPLDQHYSVMIANSSSQLIQKTLTASEYAQELKHNELANLIDQHHQLAPYEKRFIRVLRLNDTRRCDRFIRQLRNEKREQQMAIDGFFYAAQMGSIRLLDYFLSQWKIDINLIKPEDDDGQYSRTALLTAITFKQNEAAKFLLFRHADPSIKGRYDNALVTALHYQSSKDLLRLLLDKNVDLTARHPEYPKLNLREFCVLTNRVQAKKELDQYIIHLISQSNYERLKWLVDHGYPHINVNVTARRNTRLLAKERYCDNIVKLIDHVEEKQSKSRVKMNY